jgi:hypothetical protein
MLLQHLIGGEQVQRHGDRCYFLAKFRIAPPQQGAAWSTISQGHAAARPVLVAVAWQPSAVASS